MRTIYGRLYIFKHKGTKALRKIGFNTFNLSALTSMRLMNFKGILVFIKYDI